MFGNKYGLNWRVCGKWLGEVGLGEVGGVDGVLSVVGFIREKGFSDLW